MGTPVLVVTESVVFKTPDHVREKNRRYHADNKEIRNSYFRRRGRLVRLRKYGLTEQRFSEMVLERGGKCAICQKAFRDTKDTHVDHDHVTGKVRGLLCYRCNHGLGKFKDNPEFLRRAAEYLMTKKGA